MRSAAGGEDPGSPVRLRRDAGTAGASGDRSAGTALPWLIRLRWLALIAFLALPLGATIPRGRVQWLPFLGLIAAMAATNLALWRATRAAAAPRPEVVGGVLLLDTMLLTGLLFLSGGSANPGTVVYLVHITFAAVLLGPRWAWALTALSVGGFGVLFLDASHLAAGHLYAQPPDAFASHVAGMWIAFAATAALIAHFVSHVAGALAARERDLASMSARAARSERLAALTTLAAGAAHELATPLSTIAVTAREIERAASLQECPRPAACGADAALIAREVARCHRMLDEMSGRARARASDARPLALPAALEDARAELPPPDAARVDLSAAVSSAYPAIPHDDVVRVLVALLRNALDASPADGRVALQAIEERRELRITVQDHGHGMTPEVLARAHEPFFTTKAPGHGLGLGVFLARSVAEQLGGLLNIDSAAGAGTTVSLTLPAGGRGAEGR